MKKIILLLIGLTIISCSSDDDDTRTTDPFIGTWIKSYPATEDGIEYNITETYIITFDPECPYSCGTYIYTIGYDDEAPNYFSENVFSEKGDWQIVGLDRRIPSTADFNLLNQSYNFSKEIRFEGDLLSEEWKMQIRFESDFNSFEILTYNCSELFPTVCGENTFKSYREDKSAFYIRQ